MPQKRKTLVDNMQEIIDSGDLDAFKAVFDKCEITATSRGKTTRNAISYKRLTPAHIQFLIDNGADIDLAVSEFCGNALSRAVATTNLEAVRNLLECGASTDICSGWEKLSMLDAALQHYPNCIAKNR